MFMRWVLVSRNLLLVIETHGRTDGEDGRATDEACAVLLDGVSRRTSDANTVRGDVTQDRAVAASGNLIRLAALSRIPMKEGERRDKCRKK
jgi:hypothetical protein